MGFEYIRVLNAIFTNEKGLYYAGMELRRLELVKVYKSFGGR